MKRLIFALAIAACTLSGCARNYRDTTLYQLSGRQKAIVAVLPVIDRSNQTQVNWDLSREFTDEIRNKVYDSQTLYLLREGGSIEIAKLLSAPNPNAIPAMAKESLGAAQFVVLSEILEQKEMPYGVGSDTNHPVRGEIGSVLSLSMRVRIVDVRDATPRVILQEVLDQEYAIARPYLHCDYEKMGWGTHSFNNTPMGIAHNRLVQELVSRTEAYIEAAR
ncbi:MAG: hypothetical protein S4CHLAM123_02380 [Chlamydiales bacterium]|nr:hypothetical protein [Chlamydiales bacterium]